MTTEDSLRLSTLEFDVLWATQQLPPRHPALDVPSPGRTHTERTELMHRALDELTGRGLVKLDKPIGELADKLNLLARPKVGIDTWVWAEREIRALAASTGRDALLAVVDGDEVWLIPARDEALPEAAVSVAGDPRPGVGRSISLPHRVLREADQAAKGDPVALITALEDRGIPLWQAQELAGMFVGPMCRGQFGAQRLGRDGVTRRARRVIAFHDNDAGRYLFAVAPGDDGELWATLTPAGNRLLAERIWELLWET